MIFSQLALLFVLTAGATMAAGDGPVSYATATQAVEKKCCAAIVRYRHEQYPRYVPVHQ